MRYFYNTLLNGLFLLTISLMFIPFEGFSIQNPNTLDKQEEIYLKNIDSLKYKYIHGKCIALCKKASLKYTKNAYFNEVLCDEYFKIRKWEKVIKYGESFNRIDTKSYQNYKSLFESYCMLMNWQKAINLSKKVLKINPHNEEVKSNITNLKIKIGISYLSISILFIYIFYNFNKILRSKEQWFKGSILFNYFLVGSFISLIAYSLFFYFSEYIWSLNTRLPIEEYTLFARYFIEDHDGIESFILYAFSIICVFLTFLLIKKIVLIQSKFLSFCLGLVFCLSSIILILNVGFFVPILSVEYSNFQVVFIFLVVILSLTFILIFLQGKLLYWPLFILMTLLICFKATGPISNLDSSYIFMPALQIWYGDSLKLIYLQYDLLMPLITAIWMKLNMDLNLIQLFFQLTFFLFFVGLFYFLNKFFINKKIAVFAIISILLLRYYAIGHEPTAVLQCTPLRLDLWLILLTLVYFKGIYHCSVGICLGLFLIFHKNLGLIYLASYFELIFSLFLIELTDFYSKGELNFKTLMVVLLDKIKKTRFILISILVSVIIVIILFGSFTPESAILYQKLGVGMIPISKNSIFWYIPILLSVTFGLIIKFKTKIDLKYYHTALFIIFLAIGNSMYFLGRSHELNLINISALLVLPIFICIDLAYKKYILQLENKPKKYVKQLINKSPYLIIGVIFILYSKTITDNVFMQINNYKINRITYSLLNVPSSNVLSNIKTLTKNSKKVYFIYCGVKYPWDDFLFYYYGNYKPIGHYNPSVTYAFKKDYSNYLNELLNNNYYLVTRDVEYMEELVPLIHFNKIDTLGGYTSFSKKSTNK